MISERVTQLRKARGLSVGQLATKAGLTRDGVHKAESGADRQGTRVETVRNLAIALETSTDYLIGLTDNPAAVDSASMSLAPTPDLLPLVQRLNLLPAEQRKKVIAVVEATLALLD